MIRHEERGVSFEPPPGWVDKTMVAFSAPGEGGPAAANFVMTSEPLRPGDTLRTHVDRQLMNAARTLHDFVLHETQPTTLGGLPALHARFHWRAHFGELEQTVTSVRREIDGRPMVTSITTTVLIGEADATRDAFTAMLASLRFADGPDAPGAPSDPNATDPSNPFVPIPGHKRDNRDKGRS